MRILYGVQGTGHGHITRARVLLPILREMAEVDVLISGYNFKLNLEGEVKYNARGLSLTYDDKGSVHYFNTAKNFKPVMMLKEISKVPVQDYDFVINDFEPITAWAAQRAGVECVAISHQASFLSPKSPRPKQKSLLGEKILRHFAPCSKAIGSHYFRYDDHIEPPIIRKHIKALSPTLGNHITVYLPAFHPNELMRMFRNLPEIKWEVFSPYIDEQIVNHNVIINPVGKETFLKSFESCTGIMSATGFECTSEALYLNKKLLTIPIKNQYEQLCNAEALQRIGGEVIFDLTEDKIPQIKTWLKEGKTLQLDEISDEQELACKIIEAGSNKIVDRRRVALTA